MRELVRQHAAHLLAGQVPEQALGHGQRRLRVAAAGGEGVRLLGWDQIQARHGKTGPLGEVADVRIEIGRLALVDRPCPAGLERDPVGEPEHDEVEDDGDQEEGHEATRAADEAAEPHEQSAQPGDENPGTEPRTHSCVVPFRLTFAALVSRRFLPPRPAVWDSWRAAGVPGHRRSGPF